MIMASINKRKVSTPVFTYEGGKASRIGFDEKLQRTVLCCLLNEDTFYEDGESIKDRIKEYMGKVSTEFAIATLNKAKHEYHLRHTPLFMLTVLASQGKLTKELVYSTVTRVDDITELLAMYLADGKKKTLPKQLQKGLAMSFDKFDEYQFGKYKGNKKNVSLKDAVMLCHPKAPNDEKNALYKKIVDDSLATPLTWETELSAGKDKKTVFENLLSTNKLGALALLRNLRNMEQAKVSQRAIADGISKMNVRGIMPYNFYTANKHSDGTYSSSLKQQCSGQLVRRSTSWRVTPCSWSIRRVLWTTIWQVRAKSLVERLPHLSLPSWMRSVSLTRFTPSIWMHMQPHPRVLHLPTAVLVALAVLTFTVVQTVLLELTPDRLTV